MASTVWKGFISFGLISIPVRLFAAARSEHISFNQLHNVCNSRLRQQMYCPTCDRTVERSEIVKGYEFEKNRYILVDPEELKAIAPQSSDVMEIQEFVKLEEIDPLYFESSYYAVPEDPGRKAYQLLLETMRQSNFAAIAKITMHQREYTVVIRPRENGLTLHTIYYENEVRALPEYGTRKPVDVKPEEVQLARQLVEALARPFEPEKYHDTYQARVNELLQAKREGKQVTATEPRRLAPVVDLMQALRESLGETEKKPAARAGERAPAKKAAARKKPPQRKIA